MADNIRLGSRWIEDEAIENAAEQVNVADFIRSLPGGFAEEVRERGSTLVHRPEAADLVCPRAGAQSQDPDPG